MTSRIRALLATLALLVMGACRGGINAGGETATSNGGVAWIAMAGMLIGIGIVLYFAIGRGD